MIEKWGQGKTICVIDDSIDFNSTVAKLFEKSGFEGEAFFFPFPRSFFSEDKTPDLVVTDLCMPGSSGVEVIKYLREMRPETKIILVSGDAEGLEQIIEKDLSITFHLKPIISKDFLESVKHCLQN